MSTELHADPGIETLVRLALDEDGVARDVTSSCLVPPEAEAEAELVARDDGVFAGAVLLDGPSPLRRAFPRVAAERFAEDGQRITRGDRLAVLRGPARDLLALERTLLNFLQRLSGIATETARYVAAAGPRTRIQETRKTVPGWRTLDKYAVRLGGGMNHRLGLHDQVLIKENHLVHAASSRGRSPAEAVAAAVRTARTAMPPGMVLEVEVEDLAQFEAALGTAPDVIMLDDFSDADIARAVARRNACGRSPLLEISGGVRLERIAALAALGVDRISVGALTHSVRALDLALKIVPRRTT